MSAASSAWRLTTFGADVTIPIGHPCMAGGIAPARIVVDPLEAIGFVLQGPTLDRPVVFVSVDWCEIHSEAYDEWRDALAEVAGTDRQHIFLSTIHQHDAPVIDLDAQRLLEQNGALGAVCDLGFNGPTVRRVAEALRSSLAQPGRPVTHIGIGAAIVDRVASNRRHELADGSISYHRTSASVDPQAHAAPEGTIDPWLKTLSFWDGDRPLVALSHYAVHPMSYYGGGEVSADFIGLARRARQAALPDTVQMYVSGCSGNVTAGKYNDGARANRAVLAKRIEAAMTAAWEVTERFDLDTAAFRSVTLAFGPRTGPGHSAAELTERMQSDPRPYGQCLGAIGLSAQRRLAAGPPIDLPVLDFGRAVIALLPGETYVEYQLRAQEMRPDDVVFAIGYGDGLTGYIPTSLQLTERDPNLDDWCWVGASAEEVLMTGLRRALVPSLD